MVTAATYMQQHLKPGAEIHPGLAGYFLTPESVEPIQDLLDNVTATDICLIPAWDWTCSVNHTADEAKARMAKFLIQLDTKLNPHRLLSTSGIGDAHAVEVLDPRLRDIIINFLPQLRNGESYSYSEIESAADIFVNMAQKSGLELFAQSSPCHTSDPTSLTCTWSNFPQTVDQGVWLEDGATIHPRLTNSFFTKRAAAGLRNVLSKADPEAKTQLADLVLTMDKAFNPYCVRDHNVVIDGSVRALESIIDQNPSPFRDHMTPAYAWSLTKIFNDRWAFYFPVASVKHYQMLCDFEPQTTTVPNGLSALITCGYVTTAADVD